MMDIIVSDGHGQKTAMTVINKQKQSLGGMGVAVNKTPDDDFAAAGQKGQG